MAVKKELETLVVYLAADAQKYNDVLMGAEKRLEDFDSKVQKLGHSLDNVVASVTSKTSSMAAVSMGEVTKTLDTVQAKVRQVAAVLSKPIIVPVIFQMAPDARNAMVSQHLRMLGAGDPFALSMPIPRVNLSPMSFGAGSGKGSGGFWSPAHEASMGNDDYLAWVKQKWAGQEYHLDKNFVGPPRPPVGRTTMAGGDFGDGFRHLWSKMPSQAAIEKTLIAPLRGRLKASVQEVGQMMTDTFGTFRGLMRQVIYASVGAFFVSMLLSPLVAFDTAMTQVMAKMHGGFEGMRPFAEKQIKDMANKGVSTPADLASALGVLTRSGLSARDSIENLAVVERFAAANSVTATDSATSLSRALNALGLISNDSASNLANFTRLSDLLTKASALSGASVDQLAAGLGGKNSASIKQLGISMEDAIAYLAAFNKASGAGTVSMSQMHTVLNELQQSVIQHPAAWRNYVQVFEPVTGKMRTLDAITEDLQKNFHGLSDWERFVSERNLGLSSSTKDAIGSLLGMSATIKTFREQMAGAEGETGRVADIMGKSFGQAFANLKNQAILVSMSIGNVVAPMVVSLASAVRDGVKAWMGLSEGQRRAFITMGLVVLAIGPVVWILRTVGSLVNVVLFPFMALTKLLLGLGAAALSVTYFFGKLIWTIATSVLQIAVAVPLALVKELLLLLPEAMGGFGRVAVSVGSSIAAAVGPLLALLSPLLLIALGIAGFAAAGTAASSAWGKFKDSASSAMDTVKGKAGEVWEYVTNNAEGFVDKLIGFFANFQENMTTLWAWFKDNWRDVLHDTLAILGTVSTNLWSNIETGLKALVDRVEYYFGLMLTKVEKKFADWSVSPTGVAITTALGIKLAQMGAGPTAGALLIAGINDEGSYPRRKGNAYAISPVTSPEGDTEFKHFYGDMDKSLEEEIASRKQLISAYQDVIWNLRQPESLRLPVSREAKHILAFQGGDMGELARRGKGTPAIFEDVVKDLIKDNNHARRIIDAIDKQSGFDPKTNKYTNAPSIPEVVFKSLFDGMPVLKSVLPAFNLAVPPDKLHPFPAPELGNDDREDWAKGRMAGNRFPGTFKELSLRRFNLSGAGGYSRDPSQVPEQSVHDKKSHDVLQELLRQNQPAPVKVP